MNPSQALAEVLVDELVRQGVTDVVLSPGSRSAPLAYAVQDAERAGRLRLHVRVDERSAAFLALGLAKVSRRVVPVITTSGTAVANLHPAVLEAHHAAVPLLVLSCDRPAELLRTGANQTTVQPGMFGEAVRWRHEIPAPERRPGQQAVWRSVAARACAAAGGALSGWAGPVQLDVSFRDPLVPAAAGSEEGASGEDWPEPLAGRPGDAPWTVVRPAEVVPEPGLLSDVPRTVMVLGDLPEAWMAAEAVGVARSLGWPVLAEPFGAFDRADVVPHGPLLATCGDWLDAHLPDRVLVVGRLTLTRDLAALLRRLEQVEVVTPLPDWPDPASRVARVRPWSALAPAAPGEDGAPDADVAPGWRAEWQAAGEMLTAAPLWDPDEPSGPAIAAAVLDAVAAGARQAGPGPAAPDGSGGPGRPGTLFVGSSQSARDVDWAVTGALAGDVTVVGSRGLAGIDGCVSTAIGLALASGEPTTALMGDLTFLHDANGLLIGPHEPRPDLTIVVTNDDGGAIFSTLEHGDPARAADFERVFGTPTGTDVGALCAAHGVPHERVTTVPALREARARAGGGIRVVEMTLDRTQVRELRTRVRSEVARRLRPRG